MRRWTRPSALLLAAALTGAVAVLPAHAQDATCTEAYPSGEMVLDLQEIEQAIIDQDGEAAIANVSTITGNLPCIEQKLPRSFMGRVYRGIAGGYYVGGDRKTSEAWFRTAIEIDGSYRYGLEDLPGDHPLRTVYSSMLQADGVEPVRLDDRVFKREGSWFLDGRLVEAPAARPGRPHLLQLETPEGGVETWFFQGTGFPQELLEEKRVSDGRKKDKTKKKRTRFDVEVHEMGQEAREVGRSAPPEQVPLLVGGGTLIAGAVAMTFGSYLSQRNFTTIRGSETDLRKAQQGTNRLAVGAVAMAAVGAGALTYGIIIDDGGRPTGVRLRGRF